MVEEVPHHHTDECWEPDSGCDMGRNPDHAVAASPTEVLGEDPKPSDKRNGCFLDSMWACKVCDGEIPYGHILNCDIYKLERQLAQAEQTIDRYRAFVELLRRWERLYPDLKPQTLAALNEFNELYVETSQAVHAADKALTVSPPTK